MKDLAEGIRDRGRIGALTERTAAARSNVWLRQKARRHLVYSPIAPNLGARLKPNNLFDQKSRALRQPEIHRPRSGLRRVIPWCPTVF
jgi:hypothetical protein